MNNSVNLNRPLSASFGFEPILHGIGLRAPSAHRSKDYGIRRFRIMPFNVWAIEEELNSDGTPIGGTSIGAPGAGTGCDSTWIPNYMNWRRGIYCFFQEDDLREDLEKYYGYLAYCMPYSDPIRYEYRATVTAPGAGYALREFASSLHFRGIRQPYQSGLGWSNLPDMSPPSNDLHFSGEYLSELSHVMEVDHPIRFQTSYPNYKPGGESDGLGDWYGFALIPSSLSGGYNARTLDITSGTFDVMGKVSVPKWEQTGRGWYIYADGRVR